MYAQLLEFDARLYLFDMELEHPLVATPDLKSSWKIPFLGFSLPGCTKHAQARSRGIHTASSMSNFIFLCFSSARSLPGEGEGWRWREVWEDPVEPHGGAQLPVPSVRVSAWVP